MPTSSLEKDIFISEEAAKKLVEILENANVQNHEDREVIKRIEKGKELLKCLFSN